MAAAKTRFQDLKPEQMQAIIEFINGRDIFILLPIGYGNLFLPAPLLVTIELHLPLAPQAEDVVILESMHSRHRALCSVPHSAKQATWLEIPRVGPVGTLLLEVNEH